MIGAIRRVWVGDPRTPDDGARDDELIARAVLSLVAPGWSVHERKVWEDPFGGRLCPDVSVHDGKKWVALIELRTAGRSRKDGRTSERRRVQEAAYYRLASWRNMFLVVLYGAGQAARAGEIVSRLTTEGDV